MLALINLIIRRTRLAFRTPLASPCSPPPPPLIPGPVLRAAGRALGRSSCGREARGAGPQPGPPPPAQLRAPARTGGPSPGAPVRLRHRPDGHARQKARGPRSQPGPATSGSGRPRHPRHSLRPARRLQPDLAASPLTSGAPEEATPGRGARARGLPDSDPAGPASPGLGRGGRGRLHLQATGPDV